MRPFNGCIDSDMNKAILTSISLFVAACGILIARRVCVHGPVRYASSVTLAPSEAPTLKEWINNSIDEDCPPGDLLRYHPEWVSDAERAQLESVWAAAATNLLNGNVRGMKECVATVSERMKGISAGREWVDAAVHEGRLEGADASLRTRLFNAGERHSRRADSCSVS